MSTKGVLKFIDDLTVNFSFRRDWDEEREKNWSTLMVRELGGYADEVLAKACREIILTRGKRQGEQWMPTIAECLSACKEAKYWLEAEHQKQQLSLDGKPVERKTAFWSDERKALADDLIKTSQGRTAAKEGWIRGLHDFCRAKGRVPNEYEARDIKTDADAFQAAYEKALRGGWPQAAALADLGGKMVRRGEELSDMVLHGVVR